MSRSLFVTSIVTLAAASGLWGQTFQGAVRGTVSDPTGAAIGTAKVTLADQATGISRATLTGTGGEYSFTAVNPATYTVLVENPGFKRLEKKGVVVSTQEFLIVDLKLEVGDVTQSVNVTEEVPLLESENASTGQVIDNQKLADLPNMGRNPSTKASKFRRTWFPAAIPSSTAWKIRADRRKFQSPADRSAVTIISSMASQSQILKIARLSFLRSNRSRKSNFRSTRMTRKWGAPAVQDVQLVPEIRLERFSRSHFRLHLGATLAR